jgi:hypothetical protein
MTDASQDDLRVLQASIKRLSAGWHARRNASGELCWCRADKLELMLKDEALAYMTAIGRADKI